MSKRTKNTKGKSGIWRNLLTLLLVLISLILIFNTSIRNFIIGWNTNKYQIENVTTEDIANNKKMDTTFDFEQVQSISTEAVLAAQWDNQQLPVIGGIAMPDLNLNLPIFKGLSNTALMYGAGTMKENQIMGEGNYSLASHHIFGIAGASDKLFSRLSESEEGMKIYLTDKEKIYTYTVTSVESVTPDSVYVIDDVEGQKEITLVTCEDAAATMRTIVKGKFENAVAYEQSSKDAQRAFKKIYNQFQF